MTRPLPPRNRLVPLLPILERMRAYYEPTIGWFTRAGHRTFRAAWQGAMRSRDGRPALCYLRVSMTSAGLCPHADCICWMDEMDARRVLAEVGLTAVSAERLLYSYAKREGLAP